MPNLMHQHLPSIIPSIIRQVLRPRQEIISIKDPVALRLTNIIPREGRPSNSRIVRTTSYSVDIEGLRISDTVYLLQIELDGCTRVYLVQRSVVDGYSVDLLRVEGQAELGGEERVD